MKNIPKFIGLLLALAVMPSPAFAVGLTSPLPDLSWSAVFVGVFLGCILLPIIYNIGFYLLLRERFLIWYSARALTAGVFVIILSPIYLGPLLVDGSVFRQIVTYICFDFALSLSGPFLLFYCEREAFGPRMRKALLWSMPMVWCATPFAILAFANADFVAVRAAILTAEMAIILMALAQGVRNGSLMARWQAIAWAPPIAICAVSLICMYLYGRSWSLFHTMLIAALMFEILATAAGAIYRVLAIKRQRDDAVLAERVMTRAAMTDSLTKLPNRRALYAQFDDQHGPVVKAVAILDLDKFKIVNDEFGHHVGDKVLEATAIALRDHCKPGEAYAARLGGEEFALLLYGDKPALLAEQIRYAVADAIDAHIPDLERRITASLGLTHAKGGDRFEELMRRADRYLYKAKASGRDCQKNDLQHRPPLKSAA